MKRARVPHSLTGPNGASHTPIGSDRRGRAERNPPEYESPLRPTPGLAVLVLSGVALAVLVVAQSVAGAAVTAGTAIITQPGQTKPLDSGGSATEYGVELPGGAKCPGDTAHDGYRVYSYLIPKGVSLPSLTVRGETPFRGQAGHPYFGFIAFGAEYEAINTDDNTGEIATLPWEFTWSRLTPADLFPKGEKSAVWNGGIACATADGVVTDYWNTEIEFTVSSSDSGGFTWRVLDPQPSSVNWGVRISIALIVLGVAFAVIALLFGLRQRRAQDAH